VELNTFLSILWRRKSVLFIMTAVTVVVVTVVTLLATPVYEATTTLRVSTTAGRSGESVRFDDLTYIERLMNTYSRLATNDKILNKVNRELAVEERPTVKVELPANTEYMLLKAEHSDPKTAAKAADLAAQLLIREVRDQNEDVARAGQAGMSDQIAQLERELAAERRRYEGLLATEPGSARTRVAREALTLKEASLTLLVREFQETRIADALRSNSISVVEPAAIPTSQVSPRLRLNLALGLILGLLGGLGLAFLTERLDPRVQTNEQIRELTDVPVIATVPTKRHRWRADRSTRLFDGESPQQEEMRRFRAHLARHPIRTLLVTSAGVGDGKTTVVANAASVLARSGEKVVAVDWDLREPALHTVFGLPNSVGLSNVLRGELRLESAVQHVEGSSLSVVTSGAVRGDTSDLFGSRRIASVLGELANAFDVVILDSPPFLAVSDAAILAAAVQQVVVVVSRGRSRRDAVRRMFGDLGRIEANVVGLIINRSEDDSAYDGYYTRARLRAVAEDAAEDLDDNVRLPRVQGTS
jgi:succinoglycan biosynthesis transport protein ExoP